MLPTVIPPHVALVVLIWFLFLLRSAPPTQTTSPQHLTGSEGPDGANSVQKGTRSLSAASASSVPWIFHSAVELAVLLFARMKEGREDEGSAWVGWGCFGDCVVGNGVAAFSSARLTGNMLSHILSLNETLVCIPVAWLSKVFSKLFNFANNTRACSTTTTNMFWILPLP